jgi:ribosomal protein S18 acetylase RimI-like enzyme
MAGRDDDVDGGRHRDAEADADADSSDPEVSAGATGGRTDPSDDRVSVRASRPGDVDAIRRVARRSWTAAYGDFLAPETVEAAMREWYAPDAVRALVEREDVPHVVAVVERGRPPGREPDSDLDPGPGPGPVREPEPAPDPASDPGATAGSRSEAGSPPGRARVPAAADGARLVGYGGGGVEDGVGGLGALYVDPDWWDAGVGTRLLAAVTAALRERGVDRVEARVLAANDVGRAFYEARGFERVAEATTTLFGETVGEVTYARST